MSSANPVMNDQVYRNVGRSTAASGVMTMEGTVLKTAFLLLIMTATASYTWALASNPAAGPGAAAGWAIGGAIGGLVLALITTFNPSYSPYTSPLYAAAEGLFLGSISASFEAQYPGLVIQALGLSTGVLAMMLFLYGTRLVQATEQFKMGVVAATGAICLVYLVSMVARLFGTQIPYIHGSGMIGIGFSAVVVVIAALNLVIDFDFIEKGVDASAPKYMEWYGGFSLLVTLVWMYIEILRLLAKLQSRD